jgi:hypothetical protein
MYGVPSVVDGFVQKAMRFWLDANAVAPQTTPDVVQSCVNCALKMMLPVDQAVQQFDPPTRRQLTQVEAFASDQPSASTPAKMIPIIDRLSIGLPFERLRLTMSRW